MIVESENKGYYGLTFEGFSKKTFLDCDFINIFQNKDLLYIPRKLKQFSESDFLFKFSTLFQKSSDSPNNFSDVEWSIAKKQKNNFHLIFRCVGNDKDYVNSLLDYIQKKARIICVNKDKTLRINDENILMTNLEDTLDRYHLAYGSPKQYRNFLIKNKNFF